MEYLFTGLILLFGLTNILVFTTRSAAVTPLPLGTSLAVFAVAALLLTAGVYCLRKFTRLRASVASSGA